MSMVRPLSPTHLGDVKTAAMRAIEGYANRLHGWGRRTDGRRAKRAEPKKLDAAANLALR